MSGGAGAAVAGLTGRRVVGERRVSGAVSEVELDGGQVVVAKRGHAPGAVAAEAAGLAWLADAGAVRVPGVLARDETWLVVDRVAQGRATPAAAERFGRALAALHAAGAAAFGAAPPGGPREACIGTAPMANEPGADWPRWYAERRVLPYLRAAVDAGGMSVAGAAVVERVCERLPELAGPAEPPARLHGDLWNGNVVWTAAGAVLIDPAAHGGHRETDLAMLALFGLPLLDDVLAGYDEAAPLRDGWRERVPLHQLHPLAVHAASHGASYAAPLVAAAGSALKLG